MPRIGDTALIFRRGSLAVLFEYPVDPSRRFLVCQQKRRYKSMGGAENVARRMRRDGKAASDLEHYWCEFCLGWHVGHRLKLETKRDDS